jgi:hypothetical protein
MKAEIRQCFYSPRNAKDCQLPPEAAGDLGLIPSAQDWVGSHPAITLILDLQLPELQGNKFVMQATGSVVIYVCPAN